MYEHEGISKDQEAERLGKGWHWVQFIGLDKLHRRRIESWLRYRGQRKMPGTYMIELKGSEYRSLHKMLVEGCQQKGNAVLFPLCKVCEPKLQSFGLEGSSEADLNSDYFIV